MAAGDAHSLALKADGTVVAWGYGVSGQTTVPQDLDNVGAIAAGGYHNLAMKTDGTVVAWGYSGQGQTNVPAGLSGVIAIAAGGFHNLALKDDGTVTAWGYDFWGQSSVPTGLSNVVAIAAGYYYSLALKVDGTAVAWGRNTTGEGTVPANLTNVVSVSAKGFHNLALKKDGTVVAWGRDQYGETIVPTNLTGVFGIAAGYSHSLALKSDGTVVAWGNNDFGQSTVSPDPTTAVAIAAGAHHSLALLGDQMPFLIRQPVSQMVAVGSNVVLIAGVVASGSVFYQWSKDEVALFGETNSTLVLPSIQLSDAGGYTFVVTNELGSATSQVARVTVGYSLNVEVTGSGSVAVEPDQTIFDRGFTVSLSATAAANNQLANWSGDASGESNRIVLRMDGNKSVTANFLPTYTVTTATNGSGTVSISPLQMRYLQGQILQITATPGRWLGFSQWNDGSTSNPRSILVHSNAHYTATFVITTLLEALDFAGISRFAPVGMPAVFVDDASNSHSNMIPGFSWLGDFTVGAKTYVRGSAVVTLYTTLPNSTVLFTLDGSKPDFAATLYGGPLLLRNSVTLRAVAYNSDFTQSVETDPLEIIVLPTLSASTRGGGDVAVSPSAGAYFSNSRAFINATPAPGWTFLHWLGDETGTSPNASLSMTMNRCVQAIFGTAITNTVIGNGNVVRNPATELYPFGTPIRLTAVPQEGNYFAFWANAISSTNNPLTLAITTSTPTITAVFAPLPINQHALTVIADGHGEVANTPRGNRFGNGARVTLTALPNPGQEFLGWSGETSSTNNPYVVTMNQSRLVTAHFTKRPNLAPILCDGSSNPEEFQLLITGEFGGRFLMEATTNLASEPLDWQPLATVTNTFGSAQFNDPQPAKQSRKFYRAVGK